MTTKQITIITIIFLIVFMVISFLAINSRQENINGAVYYEIYNTQQEVVFWEKALIILLEDLEKDFDNARDYVILAIAKSESNRRGLFGREREKFLGREGLFFAENILSKIQQKHKWE